MLKLTIVDDEGRRTVVPFIRQEITIGRQEGNTIRLTERNVSRHHARLLRRNGTILVEDLGSYNGVRVNGERIEGTAELRGGDRVQIGDYELAIDDSAAQTPRERAPTREIEKPPGAAALPGNASPAESPSAGGAPEPDQTLRQRTTAAGEPRSTAEVDSASAPRLMALNTDLAGREFACFRTDLKIGRAPGNDIVLDHPSLSPTQARLMREASGEWQIVDLESSNGVFVNGQSFGVARLRYGDLLELGEVKLKFVAPLERENAVGAPRATSSRHLGNRALIAALVLLVITLGTLYFLAQKESPAPVAERPAPGEAPAPSARQKDVTPTGPGESLVKETAPPPGTASELPTPAAPPVASPAEIEAKLRLADAAMARRDFQGAVDILQSIKREDGSPPEQVTDPLLRANAELSAERKIDLAQKSLAAGKLGETFRLLEESAGTTAFAQEHAQLKARAEASSRRLPRKKDREPKLARVAQPQAPREAKEPAAEAAPADPAEKLYEEGTGLYRKGEYTDAASTLNECLKVNPALAKCHLALASTYAKLKEPDLGAQHYRRFVQLAPDDPQAVRVKVLLEQYDASKALPR